MNSNPNLIEELFTLIRAVSSNYELEISNTFVEDVYFLRVTGESKQSELLEAIRFRVKVEAVVKKFQLDHGVEIASEVDVEDQFSKIVDSLDSLLRAVLSDRLDQIVVEPTELSRVEIMVLLTDDELLRSKTKSDEVREILTSPFLAAGAQFVNVDLIPIDFQSPTSAAILRAIKVVSPANLKGIKAYLCDHDFHIQEGTWLKNQVEELRKRGLVLYVGGEQHVLTSAGIAAMPGLPRKTSSDIERALYLGRKRW